jgi:hypothetical protein
MAAMEPACSVLCSARRRRVQHLLSTAPTQSSEHKQHGTHGPAAVCPCTHPTNQQQTHPELHGGQAAAVLLQDGLPPRLAQLPQRVRALRVVCACEVISVWGTPAQ